MKTILIIVGITLLCIMAFSAVNKITGGEATDGTSLKSSSSSSTTITVTVSGQVTKPGTYKLKLGDTVTELLEAAGGITTNADCLAFLPSHELKAKESLYIAPLRDNTDGCSVADLEKVNLNEADASDLHSVAGFSTTVAANIVAYRASTAFETLEQIENVSGIGSATYLSTRNKIRVRDEA